jgi:hydroxyacylglutathione hydrolase
MVYEYKKTQKNESLGALAVGLVLIILVIAIIFYKSQAENKQHQSELKKQSLAENQNDEMLEIISAQELNKELLENKDIIAIDLRVEEEFVREHLIDSINIPAKDFSKSTDLLDFNKQYILIDSSGDKETIQILADEFSSLGYSGKLSYLAGGFDSWKNNYNQTISDGDPTSFTDQSKVNFINCDELKKTLDNKEDLIIIDVRKEKQYSEGHLKNSTNLFLDEIEKNRRTLPRGKKIIVYDNDGLWAFKAAVRMFDLGIFNVYAVSDGLDSWKKKNFEVVK